MCMWQSQAFAGALSLGGSVPDENGTASAWPVRSESPEMAATATAQTLDKIKQRGVLVLGSKADYKPFGFRDPSGAIVGFEPDLGKDVADRLGVKLEIEPVVSSNRMQFLQQGRIDLMIATMNDT